MPSYASWLREADTICVPEVLAVEPGVLVLEWIEEGPPGPATELLRLYKRWRQTGDSEERRKIWHAMLAIHADEMFTIGVIEAVPQPVRMRPAKGGSSTIRFWRRRDTRA